VIDYEREKDEFRLKVIKKIFKVDYTRKLVNIISEKLKYYLKNGNCARFK